MTCKLVRYSPIENKPLEKSIFTCKEVRLLFPLWDEEFRKINGVVITRKDIYYEMWKKDIEEFLKRCECNDN